MQLLLALLIGGLGGAMSGMFGIGGGIVMVPAFVYLLHFSQHQAQGTSLAVLSVPVALAGAVTYFRTGNVEIRVTAIAAIGFVIGAFLASALALSLEGNLVRKLFAVLLLLVAGQMLLTPEPEGPANRLHTETIGK